MINSEGIIKIDSVMLAHEFVLDETNRCDYYVSGRKMFGLSFALSGQAEYRFTSGDRLTLKKGEGIFLSDKSAYTIIANGYRHYTVNFYALDDGSCFFSDKEYFVFSDVAKQKFEPIFNKLVCAWQEKRAGYKMLAISCIAEIIALLIEMNVQNTYGLSYRAKRLLPAKEFLERNFKEEVSIKDLAQMCDMSQTNFRREFTAVYGKSVTEIKNQARINHAKELLSSGFYNVSETARECGFLDVNYFVRFFKSKTGIAPGKYREELLYPTTK